MSEIRVFGTTFQNPVLLASGTAGFGREVAGVVDLDALGGIVTKAVTPEPRTGHPSPRVAEFRGGMLNAVGLANPGLEHAVQHELPWLVSSLRRARIIVNVAGATIDDYVCVVRRLESVAGVTAIELNASCPNTVAGGLEFGAESGSLRELVQRCRAVSRRPLIVKLSPAVPDLVALAKVAQDAGADGLTLINTMPAELAGRLGNGFGGMSGPALLPVGVRAVRRVTREVGLPVLGVGGIRTAADAREYLDAGAVLVQVGTAAMAHPRIPEQIARGMAARA